jgi:ribosomal protein L7/L12
MTNLLIAAGLLLLGFLIGRFTAPRDRTTVVYKPTAARAAGAASISEGAPADGEIEAAIRSGRKIDAVKLYRAAYGTDLKAAKEAVEALQSRLAD